MANNTTVTRLQGCRLMEKMQHPSNRIASIGITVLIGVDVIPTLLTILANAVLLLTIFKTTSLRTPSNMLLGALCLSDLLVGVVCQPLFLAFLFKLQLFHELNITLSVVVQWSGTIVNGMSFLMVLYITMDRYVAVCHPFFYHRHATLKRYIIIVAITWVYQLLVPLASGTFYLMFFAAVTIISFAVMFFCYIKIYSIIVEKERSVLRLGKIGDEEKEILIHNREDRSNVLTVVILLVVFTVSYLPALIVILALFKPDERADPCKLSPSKYTVFMWSVLFYSLSSVINPIVYCMRIKPIKDATKNVAFCRSSRVCPA